MAADHSDSRMHPNRSHKWRTCVRIFTLTAAMVVDDCEKRELTEAAAISVAFSLAIKNAE